MPRARRRRSPSSRRASVTRSSAKYRPTPTSAPCSTSCARGVKLHKDYRIILSAHSGGGNTVIANLNKQAGGKGHHAAEVVLFEAMWKGPQQEAVSAWAKSQLDTAYNAIVSASGDAERQDAVDACPVLRAYYSGATAVYVESYTALEHDAHAEKGQECQAREQQRAADGPHAADRAGHRPGQTRWRDRRGPGRRRYPQRQEQGRRQVRRRHLVRRVRPFGNLPWTRNTADKRRRSAGSPLTAGERPKAATGGSRPSMHCFGMAVDIEAVNNPFLGNAKNHHAIAMIERATLLLAGATHDPRKTPPELKGKHSTDSEADRTARAERAAEQWDRLSADSEMLKQYLNLSGDELDGILAARREAILAWAKKSRSSSAIAGEPVGDASWWHEQLARDQAHPQGGDLKSGSKPKEHGFMTVQKELVTAQHRRQTRRLIFEA